MVNWWSTWLVVCSFEVYWYIAVGLPTTGKHQLPYVQLLLAMAIWWPMFKARCFPLLFWAKHHFSKDSIHLQSLYTSIFGRIPEIFNRWNTPRQDPYIAVLFRREKSPISPYNMSLSFQMKRKLTEHLGTDWFQESCCDLGPWLYFFFVVSIIVVPRFSTPKKKRHKNTPSRWSRVNVPINCCVASWTSHRRTSSSTACWRLWVRRCGHLSRSPFFPTIVSMVVSGSPKRW